MSSVSGFGFQNPNFSDAVDGQRIVDANGCVTIQSACGAVCLSAVDPGFGLVLVSCGSAFGVNVAGGAFFSIINPAYAVAQAEEVTEAEELMAAAMVPGGSGLSGVAAGEAETVSEDEATLAGEDAEEDVVPIEVTLYAGETGNVQIAAGPPEVGPQVLLTAVPDPEEEEAQPAIRLSVGQSFIEITEEYIKLQVGDTVYFMTDSGIAETSGPVTRELDPEEGHNFNAGEAEWTLEYAGDAKEGPTEGKEVEGGTLSNNTLELETTSGVADEEKSLKATMP